VAWRSVGATLLAPSGVSPVIAQKLDLDAIIGKGRSLKDVLAQVKTVAETDSPVLILGETGTGKELIAKAIYKLSSRRGRPFVSANCASIPAGLLESGLFGHEKGAFTSAIARTIGRFERANTGTIFLDEVGDIPLELQPKLLRVLQERQIERLGSTQTLHLDFRLIAATNRNLPEMVVDGRFRSDLYYRLNVFPIHLPALRDRSEDIPDLVWHFVARYTRRMNKRIETIGAEDLDALVNYHWPGNVRELQNVIERCVILSSGRVLAHPVLGDSKPPHTQDAPNVRTLAQIQHDHILQALEATGWVLGGPEGAAALLGVKRTTLLYKMRRLGLSRPEE
jgi:formate hydrogenlyase transcriptional activator